MADLDQDISVEGLLAGKPSGESQASFAKWLETSLRLKRAQHRPAQKRRAPVSTIA
jgi:hypothetical protein